jgi:NADH dehydrogenase
MIVVAGGTGTLGTKLVSRLAEAGVPVRVLTRDPRRAHHLAGRSVEVVSADVRDVDSVARALAGSAIVISAIHGFDGPGRVSPSSVDRAGNTNLIRAAARFGSAFVLISVVRASPSHPIGLFRAKFAAEQTLRGSGVPWTIVRATAFIETWATIMAGRLAASGSVLVFGHGDNPINFVSATDVAALVETAVVDPSLRGQAFDLGGPENPTFNQVAELLQEAAGRKATVRHISRPALRAAACLSAAVRPALARRARAALAMDTIDMTFDSTMTRRAFPALPKTDVASAVRELLAAQHAQVTR